MADLTIQVLSGGGSGPYSYGNPVPVREVVTPSSVKPLSGAAAASAVIGPFYPELARDIWITLSGNWTGNVQVQRSIDGGATKLPMTGGGYPVNNFTANAQERIGSETVAYAAYYLAITIATGSVTYDLRN